MNPRRTGSGQAKGIKEKKMARSRSRSEAQTQAAEEVAVSSEEPRADSRAKTTPDAPSDGQDPSVEPAAGGAQLGAAGQQRNAAARRGSATVERPHPTAESLPDSNGRPERAPAERGAGADDALIATGEPASAPNQDTSGASAKVAAPQAAHAAGVAPDARS